jgi:hypothetical protein
MRDELAKLGRNAAAGLRLTFFLPMSRLAFRVDVAQLLLLFVASALLDVGSDWVRYGPGAYFSLYGAGNELFSGGLMMLLAAILALAFRQAELALAIPVIAMGGYLPLQVAFTLPSALLRWGPLPVGLLAPLEMVVLGWAVLMFVRAVALALAPARPRHWVKAVAGGLLLATPLWFASTLTEPEPWWRQPELGGKLDPRFPSPISESVLAAQQEVFDDALSALDDETPGATDLYFVGFAGDATDDVFRRDVLAAQDVMDKRWDTDGKSIVLINSPRTLLDTPIATASNLRATLEEIGAAINPDEDVVMVYLASHGRRDHTLDVNLPPLELAQLTPEALRTMLDDAGIKWRIIVVSACYSGAFADELADDQTLVMTASQADRAAFGCNPRNDATYFGEALFGEGLMKADSLVGAFELAKKRVAEREKAKGLAPPSNPQIRIGDAMAEKLRELDRSGAARRAGRTV